MKHFRLLCSNVALGALLKSCVTEPAWFLPAWVAGRLQPWSWGGTASLEGVLELCADPEPEPEEEEPPGRAGKSGRTPRALPKSLGPIDSTRTFTSR